MNLLRFIVAAGICTISVGGATSSTYYFGTPHYDQQWFGEDTGPADNDCMPTSAAQVLATHDTLAWPRMVRGGVPYFERNPTGVSDLVETLKDTLNWWETSRFGLITDGTFSKIGDRVAEAAKEQDFGAEWETDDHSDLELSDFLFLTPELFPLMFSDDIQFDDIKKQLNDHGPMLYMIYSGPVYAYYGTAQSRGSKGERIIGETGSPGHSVVLKGYYEVDRGWFEDDDHWIIVETGWEREEPAWINADAVPSARYTVDIRPRGNPTTPDAPRKPILRASNNEFDGRIVLSWERFSGPQGYILYKNVVNDFSTAWSLGGLPNIVAETNVIDGVPIIRTYADANNIMRMEDNQVTNSVTYYYWLKAWHSFGERLSDPAMGKSVLMHTVFFWTLPRDGGGFALNPPPNDDNEYLPGKAVTITATNRPGYVFESLKFYPGLRSFYTVSTLEEARYRPAEPPIAVPANSNLAGPSAQSDPVPVALNNGSSLTVTGAVTVVAKFKNLRYALNLSALPAGSGTFVLDPAPGPDGKYDSYTEVRVTAVPKPGNTFTRWGTSLADVRPQRAVTIGSQDLSLTALFRVGRFRLSASVNPSGSGSVTLNPSPAGDGMYASGTRVELRANPAGSYGFNRWSGAIATVANPTSLVVTNETVVVASLTTNRFLLTLTALSGQGQIRAVPPPGPDGRYLSGTAVTLTPVPGASYAFAGWSGSASGADVPLRLIMNASKTVNARFTLNRFALTTSVDPPGSGSIALSPAPGADGKYAEGTIVRARAVPVGSNVLRSWSGAAGGTASEVTVVLNGARSLRALFAMTYSLEIEMEPPGAGWADRSVPPVNGQHHQAGINVLLTPRPSPGYEFSCWSGDVTSGEGTVSVSMNGNKRVKLKFRGPFPATPLVRGQLHREIFYGITGDKLADLWNAAKYPNRPDAADNVSRFETASNIADHYGTKLSGFLIPPLTGNYLFYLSSDDQGALFLSTNELPTAKRLIASEPQWNGPRQWITGENQGTRGSLPANISQPVTLVGGRMYYIEALMKEGSGLDNLGVTWRTPNTGAVVNGANPIPGEYLAMRAVPASSPIFSIGYSTGAIVEGGTTSIMINRQGAIDQATTVRLAVTGTALSGTDYRSLETSIPFGSGTNLQSLLLETIDDSTHEPLEHLLVKILADPSYQVVAADAVEIRITDNDPANRPLAVSIAEPSNGSIFRRGEEILVRGLISPPVESSLVVECLVDGMKRAEDRSEPFVFSLKDLAPGARIITLRALNASGASASSQSVRVQISDESALPILTLSADRVTIRESETGVVRFQVRRQGDTSTILTVNLSTGGTADRDEDYSGIPDSVALPAGATAASFELQVRSDSKNERDEFVRVALAPSRNSFALGEPSAAVVTILDDDTMNHRPYGGDPAKVPGRVEMEEFDEGAKGVAYQDSDDLNTGGKFRETGVDIEDTTDAGGGHNLGWVRAGEWLRYSINASETDRYYIRFRVASAGTGGSFGIEVDGEAVGQPLSISDTGGWQRWADVLTEPIHLRRGLHSVRVVMKTDGPSGFTGNFNYFEILPACRDSVTQPAFQPLVSQTVNEGTELNLQIKATTSGNSTALIYELGPGAPSGASISRDGRFAWRPSEAQGPGEFPILVRVRAAGESSCSASATFTVTVEEVARPPVLAAIDSQTGIVGQPLQFRATASDPDLPAQALRFSLGADAPAGTRIDPVTGAFVWVPSSAGTYYATVQVEDGVLSRSQRVTILIAATLNGAPVLTPVPQRFASEGLPIVVSFTARDPDLNQQLGYSMSGAPPGASITPQGSFRWTPSELDGGRWHQMTIRVTDTGIPPASDSDVFSIFVTEANSAPVLTPIGARAAALWRETRFTASARDDDVPAQTLTYSLSTTVSAGNPRIDPRSGLFTWTPILPGTYSFTVTVADTGTPPRSDSESFTIVVGGSGNRAPVLTQIGNRTINEGSRLAFTAAAADPDSGQTLSFSFGGTPPAGATLSTSGSFSWTPAETQGPGNYPVTIIVKDNGSPILSDSETISIQVNEVNRAPVLAVIGNRSATAGIPLAFTAAATDADHPAQTLSFSLGAGAPPGAQINRQTGRFAWTPESAGNFPLSVVVTDSASPALRDEERIIITVAPRSSSNRNPRIQEIGSKSINEETILSFNVIATDPDPGQIVTFSLGSGAPAGVQISSSGAFFWRPSEAQGPGTYRVTIIAMDNGNPARSHSEIVSITVHEVNRAPVLATIGNRTVVAGERLTFPIRATDADLPAQLLNYSVSVNLTGASVAGGTFSWTPASAGTFPATIRVRDNGLPAAEDSETFTITVAPPPRNDPPVVTPIANKSIDEGARLAFTAVAREPNAGQSVVFSLGAGAPAGAVIDLTGAFSWTPAEAQGPGRYAVTIVARDNGRPSRSASTIVNIDVREVNRAPVVARPTFEPFFARHEVRFTQRASDPDFPAQNLTFSLGAGAPSGATIDPQTGVFTWTPSSPGSPRFSLIVTDSGSPSLSATQQVSFTVHPHQTAPELKAPASSTGDFTLTWTYSWPGGVQILDRFELQESETSATDGFQEIAGLRAGVRSYRIIKDRTGTFWYRIRTFRLDPLNPSQTYGPWSKVQSVQVRVSRLAGMSASPRVLRVINDLEPLDRNGNDWSAWNTIVRVRIADSDEDLQDAHFERLSTREFTSVVDEIRDITPGGQQSINYWDFPVEGIAPDYWVFLQCGYWQFSFLPERPFMWDMWLTTVADCAGDLIGPKASAIQVEGHLSGTYELRASKILPHEHWFGSPFCN